MHTYVTKPNIGWPTYLDGTVGSRDAAVERTGRYSQRVPSRYVGYLMYSLVTNGHPLSLAAVPFELSATVPAKAFRLNE